MPVRAQQVDDPASIPRMPTAADARQGLAPLPDTDTLRQIAGAVSALAGRVDRLDERVAVGQHPRVTLADRAEALERARAFVKEQRTERMVSLRERTEAELAVARYLTGE